MQELVQLTWDFSRSFYVSYALYWQFLTYLTFLVKQVENHRKHYLRVIWDYAIFQGDAFIGVGIDGGLLKLVWGLNGPTSNKILIPAGRVADGEWHDLELKFTPDNLTLWIDNSLVNSKSVSHHTRSKPLTTDGIFYLGEKNVNQKTLYLITPSSSYDL